MLHGEGHDIIDADPTVPLLLLTEDDVNPLMVRSRHLVGNPKRKV
jgi:hypothetical protein